MLQRLVRHLADGPFREVGWEGEAAGEGAGESPRRARLRARLVTLLGVLGADAEVGSRARQLLAAADAGRRALGSRPGHGGGAGGGGGRDRKGLGTALFPL